MSGLLDDKFSDANDLLLFFPLDHCQDNHSLCVVNHGEPLRDEVAIKAVFGQATFLPDPSEPRYLLISGDITFRI